MLKSWKTSRQSREIQSEGWCLGAWCLHLPAREKQTPLRMQQLFASALSASGNLEAPVEWFNWHLCKLLACSRQKSFRTGATGNRQGTHLGGDGVFRAVREISGPRSKWREGVHRGWRFCSWEFGPCAMSGRGISMLKTSVLTLGTISCLHMDHSQVSPAQRIWPQHCWQYMGRPKAAVLSLLRKNVWREWDPNLSTTSLDLLLAGSCLLRKSMSSQERHGKPQFSKYLDKILCLWPHSRAPCAVGHRSRSEAWPWKGAGTSWVGCRPPKGCASPLMTPCCVSSKVLRAKYFELCVCWFQA